MECEELSRSQSQSHWDLGRFEWASNFDFLALVGWWDLQGSLRRRLPVPDPDSLISLDHKLESFTILEEGEGGVHLRFENGKEVRARVLVGADGINSVVRAGTVCDGPPVFRDTMTWRGRFSGTTMQDMGFKEGVEFVMVAGEGKNFTLVHLDSSVCWGGTSEWPADNPRPDPGAGGVDKYKRALGLMEGMPDFCRKSVELTDPDAIVEYAIWDRDPSDKWGEGPVTLLGDAAHPMRPSMGMGTQTTLADAVALGDSLGSAWDKGTEEVCAALREYERVRQEFTAPFVLKSREEGTKIHNKDRIKVWGGQKKYSSGNKAQLVEVTSVDDASEAS
mmetsp:Transcript_8651/g.28416  ORF Transcript_8651/g.28416 Transcript_8651/m.28416 type:complete len:334 (+) Transcript_8651:475-1476(+)